MTKVDIEDLLGDEITSEHDLLAEPDETMMQQQEPKVQVLSSDTSIDPRCLINPFIL